MTTSHRRRNSVAAAVVVAAVVVAAIIAVAVKRSHQEPITGRVEAEQWHATSRKTGRIVEMRVEEGDYVRVGDTLAIIDLPVSKRKKNAKSNYMMVEQLKAALEKAEKEYKQANELFEQGVITAGERNDVFANYKALEAQVKAAENGDASRNESAQIARVSGEVNNICRRVGESVGAGQPIMTISQTDNIYGEFTIARDKAQGLQVGSRLQVELPAFSTTIEMEICEIVASDTSATSTPNNKQAPATVEVKALPLTSIEGLRPGMALIIHDL